VNIAKQKVKIPCPKCKKEQHVSLEQIANEEQIKCVGCGKTIKLIDKNGSARKAVKNVDKSIQDLKKTLSSLDMKIKIKL